MPHFPLYLHKSCDVTSLTMAFASSLLTLYHFLPSPSTPSPPYPFLGKLVGETVCLSVQCVWREVCLTHGPGDTHTVNNPFRFPFAKLFQSPGLSTCKPMIHSEWKPSAAAPLNPWLGCRDPICLALSSPFSCVEEILPYICGSGIYGSI